MTADMVARGILEREKAFHVRVGYGVADPSIFIRDGGPSIAESMAIVGVTWRRADNKRKVGADCVRQRLVGHDGKPMLYFLDSCDDAIRTLPTLQHDDTDPEDVDTDAEDHAYDEIRYACMSRPWLRPAPGPEPSYLPRLPQETTITELIEARKARRLAAESRL